MFRVLVLAVLLSMLVPGCNPQGNATWLLEEMPVRMRVLLDVPSGYKIVNETETLVVLASDHIRVKLFKMDDREFQIRKNSHRQMASNVRTTQFGDIIVPAAKFNAGGTSGWKFAILEKNTNKTRTVEYLLTVKAGHVRVTIDRDDYEPFDEVPIEPMFASVTIALGTGKPLGGVDHEFFGRKSEYDLTKNPARLRVFADNYQFMIYDFESEPFKPFPEFSEQTSQQGWTRNQHALWVLTRALHDNDHRVDFQLKARHDPDPTASAADSSQPPAPDRHPGIVPNTRITSSSGSLPVIT